MKPWPRYSICEFCGRHTEAENKYEFSDCQHCGERVGRRNKRDLIHPGENLAGQEARRFFERSARPTFKRREKRRVRKIETDREKKVRLGYATNEMVLLEPEKLDHKIGNAIGNNAPPKPSATA